MSVTPVAAASWPPLPRDLRRNTPAAAAGTAEQPGPSPASPGRPDHPPWPVCSLLRCDLRGAANRQRVAVWRELHRVHALKLEPTQWAIPHGADGEPRLERTMALAPTGALTLVDPGHGDDASAFDRMLRRGCRKLWDPFFNQVDELSDELQFGDPSDEAHLGRFGELRLLYRELHRRDLIRLDADRALARLGECAALLGLIDDRIDAPSATSATTPARLGAGISERIDAVQLRDGSCRFTIDVDPTPPIDWELAFNHFEATVYVPSAQRSPLRGGSFAVIGVADEVDDAVERIARRIDHFEQSLS